MQFTFSLDEYRGLNGDWTILVPAEAAGNMPDRIYEMQLQAEPAGYPVGQLKARHLGSHDACEYDLYTVADLLTPKERAQLDEQAQAFLEREVAAFGHELDRLAA